MQAHRSGNQSWVSSEPGWAQGNWTQITSNNYDWEPVDNYKNNIVEPEIGETDNIMDEFVQVFGSTQWNLGNSYHSSPVSVEKQIQQQQQIQSQMQQQQQQNKRKNLIEGELSGQSLYKTELCHSFEETGSCRYGGKCQFAHGSGELRPVLRHPKYKTEVCKTFYTLGACPYGKRCRFIHTTNLGLISGGNSAPAGVTSQSFVQVSGTSNWNSGGSQNSFSNYPEQVDSYSHDSSELIGNVDETQQMPIPKISWINSFYSGAPQDTEAQLEEFDASQSPSPPNNTSSPSKRLSFFQSISMA